MRTDQASIHVNAAAPTVYRALTKADAVRQWLPPTGSRGVLHDFDPRPGGAFRMTLHFDTQDGAKAGKTTPDTDVVEGKFVEFVSDRLVRQKFQFRSDDPAFAGDMVMSWTLHAANGGTLVTVTAENVPPGIDPRDHELGMRSSLDNLARFVEAEAKRDADR